MPVFRNPEDLIKAYYGALKDASNMEGYHGGCGTIGSAKGPYPYAYNLLAPETRKELPFKTYEDSFKGTAHMTLLKLLPAYTPPDTPETVQYYMTEIETITGSPLTAANTKCPEPSYFAYYYGLVTVQNTVSGGWKIKKTDYIPEDFLCAPYHGWWWEGSAVVGVVYKNWYNLIERIDRIESRGALIRFYASGNGKDYRFDFVRLTNGQDLLLHENVKIAGVWRETDILREKDRNMKFSILNPALN